ncbi:hypothetical protein D3C76_1729970 [compost metagenome]
MFLANRLLQNDDLGIVAQFSDEAPQHGFGQAKTINLALSQGHEGRGCVVVADHFRPGNGGTDHDLGA